MGQMRKAYNIFVGKPEGKRPLGRPKRRWEDNIRTELIRNRLEVVDSIQLPHEGAVMNILVP
jgi:hypothetical protein